MATPAPRSLLPASGLGWAGVIVALAGTAALVAMLIADALQTGPDERPGFWIAWLGITAGGVLLLAAVWRGERAILVFVALVPFALFLILLLMELTGLME